MGSLGLLLRAAAAQGAGDFNGDGAHDLAVAAISERGAGIRGGVLHTLYGRPGTGLSAAGDQLWSQATAGVAEDPEDKDQFGWAQAEADFNGDRYADLAIGVPGEDVMGSADAGVVHVLYGGPSGLQAAGSQLWQQGLAGVADLPAPDDRFGHALAAGDFNGDGYADLAIGVPGQDYYFSIPAVGAVHVLFGSAAGLSSAGALFFFEGGTINLGDLLDQFGFALTAGDFNGDGRDDLAVCTLNGNASAGSVAVYYGRASGLSDRAQVWDQDSPGVGEAGETEDDFGSVLGNGDFNGDGYADLAVGVPNEWFGPIAGGGLIHVLFGGGGGLTAAASQIWTLDTPGVPGRADNADHLGNALAAGDFNGDGAHDLAVGVSGSNEWIDDGGAVLVLAGQVGLGLVAAGARLSGQGQGGLGETADIDDLFGEHLQAGDFDGDGFQDLAIGVPHEDFIPLFDVGVFHLLYGSAGGLSGARDQVWSQDSSGVRGKSEALDMFGRF
ncbi:MAG: hypothetical protein EYC70_10885 [Planctomycetota bacterium]|nr:MAG: hypothetical protein EYC70_10885 [Planctomycetota bacterium]